MMMQVTYCTTIRICLKNNPNKMRKGLGGRDPTLHLTNDPKHAVKDGKGANSDIVQKMVAFDGRLHKSGLSIGWKNKDAIET